jgi:hypothetical protein
MSGTYHKVKRSRAKTTSHFIEEDVTMKAINDPLPPFHPASPGTNFTKKKHFGR